MPLAVTTKGPDTVATILETKEPTKNNSGRTIIALKDGESDSGLKTLSPASDDMYTVHYECIVG